FLSTVQIGITLIGILTGIYSGENITSDLEAFIGRIPALAPYAHGIAVTGVVVVVTYFSLILGELVPKRIGLNRPEFIAKTLALPMRALSVITAPFIWLLTVSSNALLRVLGIRPRPGGGVTEEEIRAMVHEGAKGGAVQPIEQDIVERVFTLGDRRVSSLMTHRTELVMLDLGMDRDRVRKVVHETLFTVYPVMSSPNGDLLGVARLKDLMVHLDGAPWDLASILKEPQYLHEQAPAYRALELLKESGMHHAVIVDEHGDTVGLLTLSDILQALVGDASDFEREEFVLVDRGDGTWLVDGQYPLPDLLVRLGRSQLVRDVEVDTLGGLLLYQLGRIPAVGDRVDWMGLRLEVVDMDGARIDKVLVGSAAEGD
ncbi:MAG TPA: hemolysin family protein, partial [Flavobacteriales bacterium]|nr:hemolysin family protein [Flavobacteriales bacterium]